MTSVILCFQKKIVWCHSSGKSYRSTGEARRGLGAKKRTWCGLRRDADARHPLAVGNFSIFPVRVSKTGSRGENTRLPVPFHSRSLDSSYSVPPLFSRPARRRQASLAKGRGTAGQSPVVEGFRPVESSLKTESPSQRLTPLPAPFGKGAFWCFSESSRKNKTPLPPQRDKGANLCGTTLLARKIPAAQKLPGNGGVRRGLL